MPGNLESKLLELNQLVDQFSPNELGPWLDLVRSQFAIYSLPRTEKIEPAKTAQRYFLMLCLSHSQRLYAESHDYRYYDYETTCC